MDQTLIKNGSHMLVLQGIVDHLPLPPVLHKPGLPEGPQLMGNGGLAHAQKGRNVADAHFRPQEGADYPDPGGIAEHFKQVRKVQQYFIIGHLFPDFGYHFLVDYVAIKAFNVQGVFYHDLPLIVEYMLIYNLQAFGAYVKRFLIFLQDMRGIFHMRNEDFSGFFA
jgi:hypothetical protein